MDTKPHYYAGIGSRNTPTDMLKLIELVSEALSVDGMVLRSGHAEGADIAFERGAGPRSEIFLPWDDYNSHFGMIPGANYWYQPSQAAFDVAQEHHPAWEHLGWGAKALHARNSEIILGKDLNDPVEFVLCWCELDGQMLPAGGTAQGIRVANAWDIPVYNFWWDHDRVVAEEWVEKYEREMAKI